MPEVSTETIGHLLSEKTADADSKDYALGLIPSLLKGIGEALYPVVPVSTKDSMDTTDQQQTQPQQLPSSSTKLFSKVLPIEDGERVEPSGGKKKKNDNLPICAAGAACRTTRRRHRMQYRHPPKR